VRHELGQERVAGLIVEMPRKRSSFTSRSCSVLFIRSTRPFACGELAQMMSMLSSVSARPNCVTPPARPVEPSSFERKMLCLSLWKATGLPRRSRYARVDAK